MPLARSLYFLPLALACASLAAQEPAPKPTGKPVESKVEVPATPKTEESKSETCCEEGGAKSHHPYYHRHIRFGHHSTFGAYAQGVMPLRDLKETLDQRTGFGLGVQWTHDHGDWNASRTRLEWNTFPESGPVAASGAAAYTKTYAKNYTLSFDHLFKLNQGTLQAYLVGGLGGARWCVEQTTMTSWNSRWTTKLAITGGIGVQLTERMNLEARYVVSSVGRTFDANTLQASLGWRF